MRFPCHSANSMAILGTICVITLAGCGYGEDWLDLNDPNIQTTAAYTSNEPNDSMAMLDGNGTATENPEFSNSDHYQEEATPPSTRVEQPSNSAGSGTDTTESLDDQPISSAPESTPTPTPAQHPATGPNLPPSGVYASNNCVVSGGADFQFFKGKLDSVVNNPSRWYSRASNLLAEPVNPTPGLMTVAAGYFRMPIMAGLVKAFRLTCDDRYARIAFDSALEYINDGRQETSDNYLDWYAGSWNPAANGWNHDHAEWRAAMGIGMLLSALIDKGGSVATAANKQLLAEFLRDHVWNKWQVLAIEGGTANESNVNTIGTAGTSRIGLIALALQKYYGESLPAVQTWLTSKGGALVSMIEGHIVNGVVTNMYERVDGSSPGSIFAGTIDTSHAGDVPEYLVQAYEDGQSWISLATIQAMVRGLNEVIWDVSENGFHPAVNGTQAVNTKFTRNMGGWFALLPYGPERVDDYVAWMKGYNALHMQYDHGPWMTANLMQVVD